MWISFKTELHNSHVQLVDHFVAYVACDAPLPRARHLVRHKSFAMYSIYDWHFDFDFDFDCDYSMALVLEA